MYNENSFEIKLYFGKICKFYNKKLELIISSYKIKYLNILFERRYEENHRSK